MKAFLAGILLLTTIIVARAQSMTALDLYNNCTGKAGPELVPTCVAYIAGLMQGLIIAQNLQTAGVKFCPPKNITAGQARLIIEKYMRDHPERLDADPGTFSAGALYAAYPCPNSN